MVSRFAVGAEHPIRWPQRGAYIDIPRDDYSDPFSRVRHADAWKRGLDVVIASLALILTAPICLLAAIAVRATSPGPVFYRQERIGLNRRLDDRRQRRRTVGRERRSDDRRGENKYGKPFTMFKFRTMRIDAEREAPQWARRRDPRITFVGSILRKTRIDEVPQLVNVLQGHMSIVGPRPERAYFIEQIERELPEFQLRLRAKPGITGLAQVELGYTNTREGLRRKLDFDLAYIERLTPWMDFKILFKTVFVVLTGKGAC